MERIDPLYSTAELVFTYKPNNTYTCGGDFH